jgi:chromosome segregation ATPase
MKRNEEAGSETLQLTFSKVKELEQVIEDQTHELECLNNQLEHSIESEKKLRSAIEEIQSKHASEIESLNQTISSQERNISRLRLELLDEVSAAKKLKANLEESISQVDTLRESNRDLDSALASMKAEVRDFEAQLTDKQQALESIVAAKDSITAELNSKIEKVLEEKDIAFEQVEEVSKKMHEANESLQLITSQVKAYERSSSAKEKTIFEQKDIITRLEKTSYTLNKELKKMKSEVDQKDAKLKQLGQAKMKAEIELEEDIAVRVFPGLACVWYPPDGILMI